MRECRSIVPKEVYQTLVKRVNEAEKEHGDDDVTLLLAAAGLQVRECPKCRTKIEKNKGCDQMDCYLCGEHFTWGKAHKVQKPSAAAKPAVPQPAAASARARGSLCRLRTRDTPAYKLMRRRFGVSPPRKIAASPRGHTAAASASRGCCRLRDSRFSRR